MSTFLTGGTDVGPATRVTMQGSEARTFFLLTFALSWIVWAVAAALSARGSSGAAEQWDLSGPVFLLGVFAPAIVALALTAREGGRAGVRALLARIGRWRVRAGWYVFAAGWMAAIKLAVALVHRGVTGAWPPFGETSWLVMVGATLVST